MKNAPFKKALVALSILATVGHADMALAHSGGGTIDPGSNNGHATDLAAVTCSGGSHHLFGKIKDMSGPGGALLSFHIYKGNKMTSTTDTVPGDANYSSGVQLNGGDGVYYISVTKTGAGARIFDIIWHCMNNAGGHTDTDIAVLQFQ
jgi:hypothetical protein